MDGHRVIEVDYLDTLDNLARRTTLYLASAGVGPQILYKCVHAEADGPSWAITLSQFSCDWLDTLMFVNQSCEYFNASGSSPFRMQPATTDSCLLTDAVFLDKVTDMSLGNPSLLLGCEGMVEVASLDPNTCLLNLFSWIEGLKSTSAVDEDFDTLDMWRTLTADVAHNHNRYDDDVDPSPLMEGVVALTKLGMAMFPSPSPFDVTATLPLRVNEGKLYPNHEEFLTMLDQN